MQVANISFCDKTSLNIKSNDVKQRILDELSSIHNIRIINKHHELFDTKQHIKRFEKVPHFISIKSNGNPYYMYLTKINFVNTVIMIDKKIQSGYFYPRMIIINLQFHDDLFSNTLFDGEMIKKNENDWIYLTSDMCLYKNTSTFNDDLFKRINMLYVILETQFKVNFHDFFKIEVKKYFKFKEIHSILHDFIPNLNYTCRGLYFKPIYFKFKDVLMNFDDSLVTINGKKKKMNNVFFENKTDIIKKTMTPTTSTKQCNSFVDIAIEKTELDSSDEKDAIKVFLLQQTELPDVYKLFDENNIEVGNACIDTLKTSKYVSSCFHSISSFTIKLKFKCKKSSNDNFSSKWIPIELITET